ncbi:MAG TPA: Sua5/YciO/YrdC/YwlC family protein [Mycobacteriales bacterium]|jgi:L-threonylcarbamoyladenylate synthase|nr:Sua5/YciO/YrdC/YwlC family protein [Mycobacteriales bacterium]
MRVITESQIDIAAQAITGGRLVVAPTSRWYMVCCAADNQQACQGIFAAKQRAESKSLALVVPSKEFATEHFVLSQSASRLIEYFWPGDLALLLPWKNPRMGERHTAVGNPNALITSDPGPLGALATATGRPLAATTVNISSPTTAAEFGPAITLEQVKEFLDISKMEIAAAIDGGICPAANHLTIIDCITDKPSTLRSGLVHTRAVNAALGKTAAYEHP